MLAFLQNPWVVGIGAGVVSGLLVALATRWLFARGDRREYFQRVAMANNEAIYAIRPSVAEKALPTVELIDSLLTATADKYRVEKGHLYGVDSLSDCLIKEIMDSAFLSPSQKEEFCGLLLRLKDQELQRGAKRARVEVVRVGVRNAVELSWALGITTALLVTMTLALLPGFLDRVANWDTSPPSLLQFLSVMATVPVLAAALTLVLRRLREVREQEKLRKLRDASAISFSVHTFEGRPANPPSESNDAPRGPS